MGIIAACFVLLIWRKLWLHWEQRMLIPQNGNATASISASYGDTFTVLRGRKARPEEDAFPKFFRQCDELVKEGWWKKDVREYNDRAPRATIDALAKAIRRIGSKRKLFNCDALLPLKDLTNGTTLTDYQA